MLDEQQRRAAGKSAEVANIGKVRDQEGVGAQPQKKKAGADPFGSG